MGEDVIHLYSMAAVIPTEKPNLDDENKPFVPRAMKITFNHPKIGKTILSVEDNSENTNVMYWWSDSPAMFSSDEDEIKIFIENIVRKHPDAEVETNHLKWKKLAEKFRAA